jgi:hypothetical protein
MHASQDAQIAALAARLDELSQVCARLSQENADLRTRMSRLTPATGAAVGHQPAPDPGGAGPARASGRMAGPAAAADGKVSRRMMGKALGAAAAGVVGAVALTDATASPAAATDGNALTAGHITSAESATTVAFDGTNPGVVFLAHDTDLFASDAGHTAALGGWASHGHVASGVYGYTEVNNGDGVVGVVASSKTGNGVHAIANGAGTFALRADNGAGTAILATSPGTAPGATTLQAVITSASPGGLSTAILGQNDGHGANGMGIWGIHGGQGWGVYGEATNGIGVVGNGNTGIGVQGRGDEIGVDGSGGGIGVRATGTTAVQATGQNVGVLGNGVNIGLFGASTKIGVKGLGSGGGRGGVFAGTAAQVQFAPGAKATHPRNGKRGDLYADSTGRLWFCKKTGNPALWHQIA